MGGRAKDERIETCRQLCRKSGMALTPHHLVCLSCDRVIDFSDARLDAVAVPDTRRFGFVVSDFRVQLRGMCQECREQEDKK